MKKFVFRYEAILNKYESDEENIKNELFKAQRRFYQLSKQRDKCIADKFEFEENFSKSLSGGITASDYRLYENAQNHYRQKNERLDLQIADIQIEIISIKKRVIEAMKKRKMMEKLKEKQLDIFLDDVKASENKIVEEIVNYQSFQKGARK